MSPPVKASVIVGGVVGVLYLIKPLTLVIMSSAGAWGVYHLAQRYYRQEAPLTDTTRGAGLSDGATMSRPAQRSHLLSPVWKMLASLFTRQADLAERTRKAAILSIQATMRHSPRGLIARAIVGDVAAASEDEISRMEFTEPIRVAISSSSYGTLSMSGLGNQRNQIAEVEFQVSVPLPSAEPWEGVSASRYPGSCTIRATGCTAPPEAEQDLILEEIELYDPRQDRWITVKSRETTNRASFRDWLPWSERGSGGDLRSRLRTRD